MLLAKIFVNYILSCYTYPNSTPENVKTATTNSSNDYYGPENVLEKIPTPENVQYSSKSVDEKMLEAAQSIQSTFKELARESLNLDTDTSTNLKVSHDKTDPKSISKPAVDLFSNEELNRLPKETIQQFRVPDTTQSDPDKNPFLQKLNEINEKTKSNPSKSLGIDELMENNEGYLRDPCLIKQLYKQKGDCRKTKNIQNLGENKIDFENKSLFGKKDILVKNPDILQDLKNNNPKHLDKEPHTPILDEEELAIKEENGDNPQSLFESIDKKSLSNSVNPKSNDQKNPTEELKQSDIQKVAEKIAEKKADIESKRFTEFTGGLEDPENEGLTDDVPKKENFVNEPVVRGNFEGINNPKVNYQSLKDAKKSMNSNKMHDGEDGSNYLAQRALSMYGSIGAYDESAKQALDKIAANSGLGEESSKSLHENEKELNALKFMDEQNDAV